MSTQYNNEKLLSLDGFQDAMEQYDDSLARVAISGSYNDLTDKPTIPEDVSSLNNDANYQNADQVNSAIDQKMVTVYRPKGNVAAYANLPADPEVGDVYNVLDTGMNYAWTGSEWDALGSIIDTSNLPYLKKTGDTSSGNIIISKDSSTTYFETKRTDVGRHLQFGIGLGGSNAGIYDINAGKYITRSDDAGNVYLNEKKVSNVNKNLVFASPAND